MISFEEKINTWCPFEWGTGKIDGTFFAKGLIGVPFSFEGNPKKYYFQLDTGCSRSYLHACNLKGIIDLEKFNHKDQMDINGFIGDHKFKHNFLINKTDVEDPEDLECNFLPIGLLGLDYINKMLIIDFSNKRLSFSKEYKLNSIYKNLNYIEAKFDGKIFILNFVNDGMQIPIAYDTGASIFDLIITKERWQKLTGKNGDEEDNIIMEVSGAFGTRPKLIGATIIENLILGNFNFKNKIVYFILNPSVHTDFSKAAYDGIIGNKSFYDDHIIIFDFVNQKFGIANN